MRLFIYCTAVRFHPDQNTDLSRLVSFYPRPPLSGCSSCHSITSNKFQITGPSNSHLLRPCHSRDSRNVTQKALWQVPTYYIPLKNHRFESWTVPWVQQRNWLRRRRRRLLNKKFKCANCDQHFFMSPFTIISWSFTRPLFRSIRTWSVLYLDQ